MLDHMAYLKRCITRSVAEATESEEQTCYSSGPEYLPGEDIAYEVVSVDNAEPVVTLGCMVAMNVRS